MADFDLFVVFRRLLTLVCAVYATVCTLRSLWSWLAFFQTDRRTQVLGRYATVLLLRTRFGRFRDQWLQIGILTLLLGVVVWLHHLVES